MSDAPPVLVSCSPVSIATLAGWDTDASAKAYAAFHAIAAATLRGEPPLRSAVPPPAALLAVMARAEALGARPSAATAHAFLAHHFRPYRLHEPAFLTAYYEPVVDGAPTRGPAFTAPILARPDDLRTFGADEPRPDWAAALSAARTDADGRLSAYPDRATIERAALAGHYRPLVWLRDWVEVFLIQVQGSARVRLADGRTLRLTYAGRNGHPYVSIGRLLVEGGEIPLASMSLEALKAWLRARGQADGDGGRAVMWRNPSYIFFSAATEHGEAGPTGGAGQPLTPLVSIAVDRTVWSYGLPFWIEGALPASDTTPATFRSLCIAADTGSAIVGPARVDLFFGSGDAAGRLAGRVRHPGALTVLWPRPEPGA